ncbi:MAG: hypothetical protein GX921_11110 [Bacteroidales bacterium]|nr:hypothetical protein [Bacteroides sp.]MDD4055006.1 hypothetical protein [Bacteroides sp.]MDD4719677.1 hypothetical protein [Bacteroides sp.]NLI63326.1 hypothetical protein [Bacteroidales bacterium]NLZ96354.1 hypothetical protein [Bacteroidales bacterium]
MKRLNAKGMKVLKSCHLLLVMVWVVGVIAMAILYLLKPESSDELYMTLKIILFIDWVLVIPGALLTIIVGIIYGIFTNWGFFKHRWILVKWVVSVVVILVGTFYYSPLLEEALEIADRTRDIALHDPLVISNMTQAFISASLQGLALMILVVISVFKPWKKKSK